mgnify:CR=1 FL=1
MTSGAAGERGPVHRNPLRRTLETPQEAHLRRDLPFRVTLRIALALIVLLFAACDGVYTASGSQERSRVGGSGGWGEKDIKIAEGSATEVIELDGGGRRLDAAVTLAVEEGTFTIELLDAGGNVTLTCRATPGHPAEGRGMMETNAGEAVYRIAAEGARGVQYRIDFEFADS